MLLFVQVDQCLFTIDKFVPSVVILTRHGNGTALNPCCSLKDKQGRQKYIYKNSYWGYVLC